MDIVVWLRSLGLGKYEAAFRDNEIDQIVLPSAFGLNYRYTPLGCALAPARIIQN